MAGFAVRGVCSRADLVRALAQGGPALLDKLADLLKFEAIPDQKIEITGIANITLPAPSLSATGGQTPSLTTAVDIPFWRIESYRWIGPPLDGMDQSSNTDQQQKQSLAPSIPFPDKAPKPEPLALWSSILPRLRRFATEAVSGRALDVDAIVHRLGRGEWIQRFPRRQHRRWGQHLQLITDRSDRLVPYWSDQDEVVTHLQRYFPTRNTTKARIWEGFAEPVRLNRSGNRTRRSDAYILPAPGTLVIVLGDLGAFDQRPHALLRQWESLGRRLQQAGCRPVALIPGVLKRCPAELCRYWTILPWAWPEGSLAVDESEEQQRIERLLTLISPAIRVEPGFLRGVRRLLFKEGTDWLDAGLEAEIWQHPIMISRSSVAGTLDPNEIKHFRKRFELEKPELQRQVMALLRQWRAELPKEIWFEEICSLSDEAKKALPDSREITLAKQYFDQLAEDGVDESQMHWYLRMRRRLSEESERELQNLRGLQRLWQAVYQDDPDEPVPARFRPSSMVSGYETPQPYQITQQHNRLQFAPADSDLKGSPIGTINAGLTLLNLEQISFWKSGTPPDWASSWGEDDYGSWVSFDVTADDGRAVSQRMRWIPAGRFMMGSPENEEGRDDDEGPQHEVTISQGCWMFDTPCTQALWEIVMGENPSRFNDPQRPVEQVSWEDIQTFLERINKQIPGVELNLPSEAQWEYACRAGTTTATYVGDLEISGWDNAPLLDDIAWYGGNSGHEFDHEDGEDTADWGDEKQYPHTRAGSRKVAQKKPNSWGFYDTLGNVSEWCLDEQRDYESESITDPMGSSNQSMFCVVRGSAWDSDARFVRAAHRHALSLNERGYYLGFRAVRVQVGAEPGSGAEPPGRSISRQPERREMTEPSGVAGGRQVRLDDAESKLILPESGRFVIRSDREQLGFGVVTKPQWAKAIGRDRFGLWVDIEVETVIQRMRWISPGQFVMGSPKGENGRYDDEGPQHNVILSKGYWLFDTPCTQALWQVVMKQNPSKFQDPLRPVENVSWLNVQEFLQKINIHIDGLNLTLPTEAQWEYACRAGTTTTTYAGDLDISDDNIAPLLDAIAWYGDNSRNDPRGTRQVAQKPANPWGLYDMLGNVYEWCVDGMRGYETTVAIDPIELPNELNTHVVRGGSWDSGARHVRAAYRYANKLVFHEDYMGFRCARA